MDDLPSKLAKIMRYSVGYLDTKCFYKTMRQVSNEGIRVLGKFLKKQAFKS